MYWAEPTSTPLRWLLLRWVTFVGWSQRWSWLTPAEWASRRQSWSPARRAVRLLGAAVFWAASLWSIITGESYPVMKVAVVIVIGTCMLIGLPDWLSDGKRRDWDRRR